MHCVQPVFCERPCAQIDGLYAKYFGFSNSPIDSASSAAAFACASGSAPWREITLRRLMLPEPPFGLQVEHGVEARAPRRVAAVEVDRADGAAGGDACAVVLAAIEIDLEIPRDRVLGARGDAGVAARADVEVDRVFLRPLRVERAEPAFERDSRAGDDGKVARGRQLGVARRLRREHGDGQPGDSASAQRSAASSGPDDQQLPFRLVADARHRLRVGQRRGGQQRGDLRRRARTLPPTSRRSRGC